jgi:hypothetical protein
MDSHFPNEYGLEGPAILGAYGMGLQGWDVSYLFQNSDDGNFSSRLGRDQWDVTAPQLLGIFPAVARQVLRGDVQQSPVVAKRNVHFPSLFRGEIGFDDKVVQGYDVKELDSSKVPARALAVARSEVDFTSKPEETPVFSLAPYEKNGALISATNQLSWTESPDTPTGGFFTMNTPGHQSGRGLRAEPAICPRRSHHRTAKSLRRDLCHGARAAGDPSQPPRICSLSRWRGHATRAEVFARRRSRSGARRRPDCDGAGAKRASRCAEPERRKFSRLITTGN